LRGFGGRVRSSLFLVFSQSSIAITNQFHGKESEGGGESVVSFI